MQSKDPTITATTTMHVWGGWAFLRVGSWEWIRMGATEGLFDMYKMISWGFHRTCHCTCRYLRELRWDGSEGEIQRAFLGQAKAACYMYNSWGLGQTSHAKLQHP